LIDWTVEPVAIEALPKVAYYLALLFAVGTCGARGLNRALSRRRPADLSAAAFDHVLGAMLLAAAAALVAALLARAWAHTVAAFGASEALAWDNVRLMAWESEWGLAWRAQAALSLALVGAGLVTRVAPSVGWPVASALAVACCYALPLLGHAAGEPARVLLHGSHVLGAGLWLGALGALHLGHSSRASRDNDLAHFAPLALTGAVVIVITGAFSVWLYLGAPSNLWAHPYGRTLLLKLAAVTGVALCGAMNWRRYRGDATGDRLAPDSLRVVTMELLLAAFVVALTAVLTELPHP
jgi:putative copper export protein